MSKKPKETLTSKFLHGPPPDGEKHLPIPPEPPEGRQPIARLGLRISPKVPYSADLLANRILTASKNSFSRRQTIFICDTNVFIEDMDQVVWDALYEAQVLVIPPVWQELQNVWITSPRYDSKTRNLFLDSARAGNEKSPFQFASLPKNRNIIAAAEGYVNLLNVRKHAFEILGVQFEGENGRWPSDHEIQKLVNLHCGERGYQLASRATKNPNRPFPFADEEVVTTAIFFALFSGNEVVLLTRDVGVLDQFYKMVWLLDTHYRSMLLAANFSAEPNKYGAVPMPEGDPMVGDAFESGYNLLLPRDADQLASVLPASYSPLPIYCFLVGSSGPQNVMTSLCFCAEKEMREVVLIRGRTGLNTDRLGGMNCHAYLFPLSFVPPGLYSGVVKDRMMSFGGKCPVSWIDFHHSLLQSERFRQIVVGDPQWEAAATD